MTVPTPSCRTCSGIHRTSSEALDPLALDLTPGGPRHEAGVTKEGWPARLLILAAGAWQIGPSAVLPPTCRYSPSCSAYAIEAVRRYGAARGGWLAAKRIARCHPWGGHGYDPVP